MTPNEKQFENFVSNIQFDDTPDPSHRDKLEQKLLRALAKQTRRKDSPLKMWRTIMKSRMTKLAAAAVIIIAVLIGLHFTANPFEATVTFAEVIQPILNAQTAILDIIVGEEDAGGPVIHDMIMSSRIRRTLSSVKSSVSIIDLETSRILSLDSKKKEAAYIDLKGLPSIPNYMEILRNVITELQDSPDFVVEELGEREFQGRRLIGFRATHPKAEVTIWADPETALPVRIEQVGGQMKVTCKNLMFDVPMDKSLFSMDAPEGYTHQEVELDLTGSTEEDFIKGLRVRAELLGDGQFPEGVAVADYLRQAPTMGKKIEELGLSDEEATELGMKLSRHLLFIRFFKGQGKWHYAGKGVKLGDAETPIFWYCPMGSETYRVIYGDLSVRDVAPEDLPEPLSAEEKAQRSQAHQQWSKSEFVGTQEDLWHVIDSDDIEVHSDITLRKRPEDATVIPIALPYKSGKLQEVTMGGTPVVFHQVEGGRYELEMPLAGLSETETKIQCRWTLSVNVLERADYSYRTILKSLIPVVSYKLTVSLGPESNYEYTKAPEQQSFTPFSCNSKSPNIHFGSCGLLMEKRN
ncbi:MAG: LolA family protein [Planctomycetota bacterium]|jgi:hypothetical protein